MKRELCRYFELIRGGVGFCSIEIDIPRSYKVNMCSNLDKKLIGLHVCNDCKFHEPLYDDVSHMWE